MFDWIKLALLLLGIVDKIITGARNQGLIDQGRDEEIARATAGILRKTVAGKAIMEKVHAMSDADLDAALRGLEPE